MRVSYAELKGIVVLRDLLEITSRMTRAHLTAGEMLKAFTAGISAANADDEDEFRSFLTLAVSSLGLSQSDVAQRLMVTRVTLQRWLSGASLPTRYARRGLLAEISELAFEAIDAIYQRDAGHSGNSEVAHIAGGPPLGATCPTLRA